MFGLLYYLFCLPIFQYIVCTMGLCNFGRLEDSAFAMKQMADNPVIIAQYFGIICSISCFNVFGIATTKYASAAQRSTIDTSRTILIWICSCAFLGEAFLPLSMIGFVMLAFGTLMYNEIFELPFWGFNEWTKRAIAARNQDSANPEDLKDESYMATSPHAAYDSNRNKRAIADATKEEKDGDFLLNTADGISDPMVD